MKITVFIDDHQFHCVGKGFSDKNACAAYISRAYTKNLSLTFILEFGGGKLLLPPAKVQEAIILISDDAEDGQTMNNQKPTIQWPKIFELGTIDNLPPEALCADGLTAWDNVQAGYDLPYNFGTIMAQISITLGISGTPESFMEWSANYIKEQKR